MLQCYKCMPNIALNFSINIIVKNWIFTNVIFSEPTKRFFFLVFIEKQKYKDLVIRRTGVYANFIKIKYKIIWYKYNYATKKSENFRVYLTYIDTKQYIIIAVFCSTCTYNTVYFIMFFANKQTNKHTIP